MHNGTKGIIKKSYPDITKDENTNVDLGSNLKSRIIRMGELLRIPLDELLKLQSGDADAEEKLLIQEVIFLKRQLESLESQLKDKESQLKDKEEIIRLYKQNQKSP